MHRIGLNPLNLNWKKIIHLCAKAVRNSFCFILKKPSKTHRQRNKSSKKACKQKNTLKKHEVTNLKKQTLTQFYIISTTACNRKPLMNSVGFRSRRMLLVKRQKAPTTFISIPAMGTLQALHTNKLYKDITSKFEQFLSFNILWKAFETGNSNVCGNRQHMIAISLLLMEGVCCVCG